MSEAWTPGRDDLALAQIGASNPTDHPWAVAARAALNILARPAPAADELGELLDALTWDVAGDAGTRAVIEALFARQERELHRERNVSEGRRQLYESTQEALDRARREIERLRHIAAEAYPGIAHDHQQALVRAEAAERERDELRGLLREFLDAAEHQVSNFISNLDQGLCARVVRSGALGTGGE